MKILLLFIIISAVNVILSTTRQLLTVNGSKWVAALSCAIYNAFNNILVIYTVADFPLWEKCLITFTCNLLCVAIVKSVEAKYKPISMWKIEMALPKIYYVQPDRIRDMIKEKDIDCLFGTVGKKVVFNCYCDTKEQVKYLKKICKWYNGKMSAYESAPL